MMTQFDAKEVAAHVKETWSRTASSYLAGFGALVGEAIPPLLDKVDVREGDRALDLGTGPGMAAAAAAKRGAQVVAVDFSPKMLAEARRLHPEIAFREAAAEALPFEDGEFDVVIGNFLLHYSSDPQQVLEETYRVLKPGGRMGFTVWADPAKLEAFRLFSSAVEQHAPAAELPHGPLFGVSDFNVFHNMMQQAGFENSSVVEVNTAWRTRSLETYLAVYRDWANLAAFPEELQEAIEGSVQEGAAAYYSGDEYVMPNPTILISASR